MDTILITGGTGLVGRYLTKKFTDRGYKVVVLSRWENKAKDKDNDDSKAQGVDYYQWDIDKQVVDNYAIASADYIVHLAGANIGDKRWSKKRKEIILYSRIKSAQLLFEKLKKNNHKLRAFISASAIGYYGAITSEKIFNETDPPSKDFLGETCQQWEQATFKFKELGIRTVVLRTGVVLTKKGGALEKMITPVKMGICSALGSGKQHMPWIHIDDLCNIFIKAIEDVKMKGAYNAVAPQHITNKDFMKALAHSLHKPFWFPNIPAFLLKLIFGKMSDILLKGSRVSCDKITKAGYNFQFSDLRSALSDLV